MNEKILSYVNGLFEDAPKKRRILEIQEELLSNMNERYEDLLRQGKSEEDAFEIVVSGVGDIDGLINDVSEESRQTFAAAASDRKRGALLLAIGVALYTFGVALMILSSFLMLEEVGVVVMLTMFSIATGLVIYGSSLMRKKYIKEDDTFVEEYKEKATSSDRSSRMLAALSSSLWTLIVLLYFLVSFLTGAWHISWIIFIVGAVLQEAIRSIVRGKVNVGGIIWTSTVIVYLVVSFQTGRWDVSWLVFLAAAAVQQIVRLVNIWREQ